MIKRDTVLSRASESCDDFQQAGKDSEILNEMKFEIHGKKNLDAISRARARDSNFARARV